MSEIELILKELSSIKTILEGDKGDNGMKFMLGQLMIKNESCQKELTEHKSNHWKLIGLTISGTCLCVAIITLVMR